MDKRIIIGALLLAVLLSPLCTENKETPTAAGQTQPTTTTVIPLTELQKEACTSADQGGTCESKLKELNIVALEDCCKYLGKCCV